MSGRRLRRSSVAQARNLTVTSDKLSVDVASRAVAVLHRVIYVLICDDQGLRFRRPGTPDAPYGKVTGTRRPAAVTAGEPLRGATGFVVPFTCGDRTCSATVRSAVLSPVRRLRCHPPQARTRCGGHIAAACSEPGGEPR